MPVPKEILAVERPKNTIVKKSGEHWLVIKRTCRRVNGRNLPVNLGTIGEIVNGAYVEKRKEPRKKRIDIKDFGEVALCDMFGRDLVQDLSDVWDTKDGIRLYVMALLRAAYGDIKNRDLQTQYETSFASEMYPGVHLSENTVGEFLEKIGRAYSLIVEFMRGRVQKFLGKRIAIDGMLKDYNSTQSTLSEFSRKGAKKGSRDISLMYAYDLETKEPVAAKPYAGNMLDQTSIHDFIREYAVNDALMVFDKGFYTNGLVESVMNEKGLSYLVPLKSDSKIIANYGMDNPTEPLSGYTDGTILCKTCRMKNGDYLYSFRDPWITAEQDVCYIKKNLKKKAFDGGRYADKRNMFGVVVFRSKTKMTPLTAYEAYAQRWEIETLFNLYKNIVDRGEVNVHGDYRLYGTELVNFLTTIIASRVKSHIVRKGLNRDYSYKQIFNYLSKYKKVRTSEKWETPTMLKYISQMIENLGI